MKTFLVLSLVVAGTLFEQLVAQAAPIGKTAPDAAIVNADGKKQTLTELKGSAKVLVVGFFSNNCPFNVKRWARIAALAKEYQGKGVQFVGINPNPKETLHSVIEAARKHGIEYPILRDEGKGLVNALDAKATPHMFVFDEKGVLRYAGAFDDDAEGKNVKEQYAKQAIKSVLTGREVTTPEPKAFIGCSIKD